MVMESKRGEKDRFFQPKKEPQYLVFNEIEGKKAYDDLKARPFPRDRQGYFLLRESSVPGCITIECFDSNQKEARIRLALTKNNNFVTASQATPDELLSKMQSGKLQAITKENAHLHMQSLNKVLNTLAGKKIVGEDATIDINLTHSEKWLKPPSKKEAAAGYGYDLDDYKHAIENEESEKKRYGSDF